jgi:protein gp37
VLRPARVLLPWTDPQMREARRIFLVSMSDPFHSGILIEDLALVWAMMAADAATGYQVLTKRPGVMRSRLGRPDFRDLMRDGFGRLAGLA